MIFWRLQRLVTFAQLSPTKNILPLWNGDIKRGPTILYHSQSKFVDVASDGCLLAETAIMKSNDNPFFPFSLLSSNGIVVPSADWGPQHELGQRRQFKANESGGRLCALLTNTKSSRHETSTQNILRNDSCHRNRRIFRRTQSALSE